MKRAALTLAAALTVLAACSRKPDPSTENDTRIGTVVQHPLDDLLELVEIEGMPCLVWKDRTPHSSYSGITCDWDQYEPQEVPG